MELELQTNKKLEHFWLESDSIRQLNHYLIVESSDVIRLDGFRLQYSVTPAQTKGNRNSDKNYRLSVEVASRDWICQLEHWTRGRADSKWRWARRKFARSARRPPGSYRRWPAAPRFYCWSPFPHGLILTRSAPQRRSTDPDVCAKHLVGIPILIFICAVAFSTSSFSFLIQLSNFLHNVQLESIDKWIIFFGVFLHEKYRQM